MTMFEIYFFYNKKTIIKLSNNFVKLQARELKSIHLDAEGQFVKLLIHKNHVNRYNLYNQVRHLISSSLCINYCIMID